MPVGITDVTIYEGSVTPAALDTETDVIVVEPTDTTYPFLFEGLLSLSELSAGDSVDVKIYSSEVSPISYKLVGGKTYADAQEFTLIKFRLMGFRYGVKVTIKQTAGTLRSFAYQFYVYTLGVV